MNTDKMIDNLIKRLQKYKDDKAESEKQDAVFYSKLNDIKKVLNTAVSNLDNNLLDELGIDLQINTEKLEDIDYVRKLYQDIEDAIIKLEKEGIRLLEGAGFVEN